jgi:nitroreductase
VRAVKTTADVEVLDIESVIAAASRAPSIHNTQPWRWVLTDGVLDVRADRSRQLQVADPDGHSLLISCGAVVELTELAMRARGWNVETTLLPDHADTDLLARFRVSGETAHNETTEHMLAAALARRSERRVFGAGTVADDVSERLRGAAAEPGVYVHFPTRGDESLNLAVAVSAADRFERDDPAYAAELASWVRQGDRSRDGIPDSTIPYVPGGEPRHSDIPLRDFEAGIPGGTLATTNVDERPLIAVIFTDTDDERQRLRAGQAMMRLMIQAELDGLASCPLSQSVDLVAFRTRLRNLMSWSGHPQMILRLGPKSTDAPAPFTARRPIDEVLTIQQPA